MPIKKKYVQLFYCTHHFFLCMYSFILLAMSKRQFGSLGWSPEGTPQSKRAGPAGTPESSEAPTSPPTPISLPPSYGEAVSGEEPDLSYGPRWCWRWEWRLCVVQPVIPDAASPVPPHSGLERSSSSSTCSGPPSASPSSLQTATGSPTNSTPQSASPISPNLPSVMPAPRTPNPILHPGGSTVEERGWSTASGAGCRPFKRTGRGYGTGGGTSRARQAMVICKEGGTNRNQQIGTLQVF